MNNRKDEIENILCQYAELVPGKGMHSGYIENAAILWNLYLEALEYMNCERTDESVRELSKISEKMKGILNGTGKQYYDEIDFDL